MRSKDITGNKSSVFYQMLFDTQGSSENAQEEENEEGVITLITC